jgi:hypothetical protein
MLAFDRALFVPLHSECVRLAMDYRGPTARSVSEDGHMHVALSNISKATVNPYWGEEIPNYEELGLEPDKKYFLLRHPGELAKAAPSFNNLPILADHQPINSAKHPADLVIGSTGTDAVFQHPYLRNSLVFWTQPAIDAINKENQKELSCAYHYDPVMTPGVFEGQRYDGVMTNIRGNHVALVKDGRAGSDVVVQDSAFVERSSNMPRITPAGMVAKSALFTYLTPRLAQDAKLDYNRMVAGVTSKNYRAKRGDILKAVHAATKGRLAQDADIQDLANLLDALSPSAGMADAEMATMPNGGPPMAAQPPMQPPAPPPPMQPQEGQDVDEPGDIVAKIKAYLEEQGVAPEILQNLDAFLAVPENPKPDVGDPAQEAPAAPAQQPDPPGKESKPPSEDNALAGETGVTGLDNELEDMVPEVDEVNRPAIIGSGENPQIVTSDEDEDEDDWKKRIGNDGVIPEEQEGQVVTKTAMDAAIQAAVTKAQETAIRNQRAIRNAERFVRPWVGDLAMDAARPSDIYRATLKALGMDAKQVDKMHADALLPVLESRPKPSARARTSERYIAQDAKPEASFLERFPDAKNITVQ